MSNIFILVKCKNFLPENITKKFIPSAITNNFLWIGGNSLNNYHLNQYRGPSKNIILFKKHISVFLQNAKNKNKIKCFSVISGNKTYLDKPSEHYFSINQDNQNNQDIILPIENNLKKITINSNINSNINLIKVISKLPKTKYGYYLPISLSSTLRGHPIKIAYDVFITIGKNNIIVQSENKYAIKNTKIWLTRLMKLLDKSKCF